MVRTRSACRSSSTAIIASASETPAAAAAISGSKGSPPTAAPSSTRRPVLDRGPELFAEGGGNCGWDPEDGRRDLGSGSLSVIALERPGELLEVERVAAAFLVEDGRSGGVDPVGEKLTGLGLREAADLDPRQCRRPMRPLERRRKSPRHLVLADRKRDEDGGGRRSAEERAEQLDGGRVCPVEVVQHEDERMRVASCSSSTRTARWLR